MKCGRESWLSDLAAGLAGRLVSPPRHSPRLSWCLATGLTVAIGWTYYATGGVISLQILYLAPLILAVSWLGARGGVTVAVLCTLVRLLGDVANASPEFFASSSLLRVGSNRLSSLLLYLVLAAVIHQLVLLNRQLELRVKARTTALKKANEARERLQNLLLEVGRRERGAIGRDLHDGLGQHLTATAMAVRILAGRLQARGDALAADARVIEGLVTSAIDQSRQIARGLLLEHIDPGQLASELEELAATASRHGRNPCVFVQVGEIEGLSGTMASHLFYIAREAVRNALRHGEASRVHIQLTIGKTTVELAVADDGRGIANGPPHRGMGLHIMVHRAELMGGSLEVNRNPGGGTRIDCRVPLDSTVPACS